MPQEKKYKHKPRKYLSKIRGNCSLIQCGEDLGMGRAWEKIENGSLNNIKLVLPALFLFSKRFGVDFNEVIEQELHYLLQLSDDTEKYEKEFAKDTLQFPDLLKSLRIGERLSQSKLADKICCSRNMISLWEMGKSIPSTDMLDRICYILKVPSDFFDVSLAHDRKLRKYLKQEARNEKTGDM
ncbi:MAG: helix-turn-helix transcriptional regulator [Ruminococcus albus]|nr:helix-turn-helix transcriptional regulator [Ruminococcus albus]